MFDNYYVIIDEFHNLSTDDIISAENEEKTAMNELLTSSSIILFMSATPRLFDDEEELNENIFGNIDYKYEMGSAIQNGYICDYEIYIPIINSEHEIKDIYAELKTNIFDKDLMIKSQFLMKGILELGCKKTIIYLRTQEEAINMKKCILIINEYYYLDIYCDTITANDSKIDRKNKLKIFEEFNGYAFLCSVEILNECIDIPKCDSIYITYPSKSKIKNIQRLCRANRKDNENKNKIARIFLWCQEYDETVYIIQHLKEFDSSFTISKIQLFNSKNNNEPIIKRNNEKYKIEYDILDNFIIKMRIIESLKKNYDILFNWININNKIPSQTSNDEEEKRLGLLCRRIRKKYNCNQLSEETIKLFSMIPIWQWSKDEQFTNTLIELKEWISKNNKFPSKNNDIIEKKLNTWCQNKRIDYRKGILSKERINELEKIKDWSWGKDFDFKQNYNKVMTWVNKYDKIPSEKSIDETEKKLGIWYCYQCIS